jgi:hypothetical protein
VWGVGERERGVRDSKEGGEGDSEDDAVSLSFFLFPLFF